MNTIDNEQNNSQTEMDVNNDMESIYKKVFDSEKEEDNSNTKADSAQQKVNDPSKPPTDIDDDNVGELSDDEDVDEDESIKTDDDEDDADDDISDEDEDEDEDEDGNKITNDDNPKPTPIKIKTIKKLISQPEDVFGSTIIDPDDIELNEDDYNSDEEEYENEDYQKIDNDLRKNYIEMNHPEVMTHNYDEIYKLSNVVRHNDHIVDAAHRTLPMLTKYEKARILGVRAKQINNGSIPFIELTDNIIDGYLIAELELQAKKIPFIIRRPLPNRSSEYWRLEDLELIC